MRDLPAPIQPEHWIVQIFSARSAAEGGIVRRKVANVERLIGRERFAQEVRRRGYCAVENGGQFVIFCNVEPVRILT